MARASLSTWDRCSDTNGGGLRMRQHRLPMGRCRPSPAKRKPYRRLPRTTAISDAELPLSDGTVSYGSSGGRDSAGPPNNTLYRRVLGLIRSLGR